MISIYLCSYNGERFIEEQLASIAAQTMQADEVIISDDGSSDHTVYIINSFIKQNNLERSWKVIENKQTLGYPRNFYIGIERCRGEYIFFADQDDVWEADKISVMTKILQFHNNINVLACSHDAINENGQKIHSLLIPHSRKKLRELSRIDISDVLYEYKWPGMVMAIRKNWAEEFIASVAFCSVPHDILLAIIAALSGTFWEINIIGAHHRRHSRNTAREKHKLKSLLHYESHLYDITKEIDLYNEMNNIVFKLYENKLALIDEKVQWLQVRLNLLMTGSIKEYSKYVMRNRRSVRVYSVIRDLIVFLYSKKRIGHSC